MKKTFIAPEARITQMEPARIIASSAVGVENTPQDNVQGDARNSSGLWGYETD